MVQGAKEVFSRIKRSCIPCRRQSDKVLIHPYGNLQKSQLIASRCFNNCSMDLSGPFKVLKTRADRKTRNMTAVTKVHVAVFVCLYSKMTHFEVIENKTAEGILQAIIRLSSLFGPPSHITLDQDSGEIKCLRDSEFVTEVDGRLILNRGFSYTIVPVGKHSNNGAAEARVRAAKRLLGALDMCACEVSILGLVTLLAQAASLINQTPLGSMTRQDQKELYCVSPLDFCLMGASRPLVKNFMSFPTTLDNHFLNMEKCWNTMVKMHAEHLVPALLHLAAIFFMSSLEALSF